MRPLFTLIFIAAMYIIVVAIISGGMQ